MVKLIEPNIHPNQVDIGREFETMTVGDMMRWLRVSRSTIKVWVKRGEIPQPVRVGKSLRWKVSDMQEWFAAKKAGVAPLSSTAPSIPVLDDQFRDGMKMVSESEGGWPE